MTRNTVFANSFLLGFDHLERLIERSSKSAGDGYPPYNIEQIGEDRLKITLAVAGFSRDDLTITVSDQQLLIRGKQAELAGREFLYRGIAARQFQRTFVLADGIDIAGADLADGLLTIDLTRPSAPSIVKKIAIRPAGDGDGDEAADGASK